MWPSHFTRREAMGMYQPEMTETLVQWCPLWHSHFPPMNGHNIDIDETIFLSQKDSQHIFMSITIFSVHGNYIIIIDQTDSAAD